MPFTRKTCSQESGLAPALSIALYLLIGLLLLTSSHAGSAQRRTRQPPRLARPNPVKPSGPPSCPLPSKAPVDVSDDDIIRVETNLVNTLFTAVDKDHRFITNLRQDDLRVLEDGVPQTISVFQRETDLPLSLAVIVDVSKSQERTLPDEQRAAQEFLRSVLRADRDQAAAISFNGQATVEQELTNDRERLALAINRLKVETPPDNPDCERDDKSVEDDPRCWSGVWDAVWATSNEVLSQTPERRRRAIILVTDGYDTSSGTKKQEAIDFAVKHNVVIYGIGITDSDYPVDRGALRKVADHTGGRAFFPGNETELRAAFTQIEQELRSQYLIAYSPQNKSRDGTFRHLRVEIANAELKKQKIRLLYREGYYAKR